MKKTHDDMITALKSWLDTAPDKIRLEMFYYSVFPCKHENLGRVRDSWGCLDCELFSGGWWCPKSPDNWCHYYSEEENGKRVVFLAKGEKFFLPEKHIHQNESEDSCIFCGLPDGRK